jgi:tRNA1(Val) A37 N6-methylase TrmN6
MSSPGDADRRTSGAPYGRPAPPRDGAPPGDLSPDFGPLTDDALTRDFRVWQRERGHRYSLDDVTVAWEAACAAPEARTVLDLGCGIGSVLLMLAWRLPVAHLVGIEAQDVSVELARRNVARNGVGARVSLVHADLRDPTARRRARAAIGGGRFQLVTGTPPYAPPGTATPSPDPQRAHARVELRGGIEDYLLAVADTLAPRGVAVVCGDARRPDRAYAGARAAGLRIVRERPVVPRAGRKGPLFTVWTLRRDAGDRPGQAGDGAIEREAPLVARTEGGARTEVSRALRSFFGLPLPEGEAPSP